MPETRLARARSGYEDYVYQPLRAIRCPVCCADSVAPKDDYYLLCSVCGFSFCDLKHIEYIAASDIAGSRIGVSKNIRAVAAKWRSFYEKPMA